jgi:radical SAM superfamily enzyme YgiQ (UPF0313 family)
MKLKLINPGFKNMRTRTFKSFMDRYWFPILAMPMIAALTPDKYEISFTDEIFGDIDFEEHVDIVGITATTAQANRAYKLADYYREKGIPVIIGGIHASSLPKEAKKHADSIVVGEADDIWQLVLQDFENDRLQPFYRKELVVDIAKLPWPRRNIYNGIRIPVNGTVNSVQVARGCPYNCNFCSVTEFFGHKVRLRPIDDVVDEVVDINDPMICFVDDNILINAKYSRELFTRLSDLNIQWGGQCTINVAENEELLDLCAKSGCKSLLIGIESVNEGSIESIGKRVNKIERYQDNIKRIQDAGIMVMGSFIFGLDEDDESIFESTWNFIKNSEMMIPLFNILTPFPNTRIFKQFEEENRIINYDWSDYNTHTVVYKPKKMTAEKLLYGYNWLYNQHHTVIGNKVKYNSLNWT